MKKDKPNSLLNPNETEIRNYFESQGYVVTKIGGSEKKADFRISNNEICFLCETKSIKSVHVYLPLNPSWRGKHTEYHFNEFGKDITTWVKSSIIVTFPLCLRVDSSPIYVPNTKEKELFMEWLEGELQSLGSDVNSGHQTVFHEASIPA